MRVRDPELLQALCRAPLKAATFVHLDDADIEEITTIGRCESLVDLSLAGNRLKVLPWGLTMCRQLWRLTVARNKLTAVPELKTFTALGHVDLSHNMLKYDALAELREVHIVHLLIEGCPGVAGTPLTQQERYNLIHLLPFLWVLNGHFITESERLDASVRAERYISDLVSAKDKQLQDATEKVDASGGARSFLASGGEFESERNARRDMVGAMASELMSVLSGQPPVGRHRDVSRLTHLAAFYEREVTQHNECILHEPQLSDSALSRKPPMHLRAVLALSGRLRLDIAVLLASTIHNSAPATMLEDTLCILCLHHLPLSNAKDLAALPAYAVASLCLFTRELARQRIRFNEEEYGAIEVHLLDALEAAIHGVCTAIHPGANNTVNSAIGEEKAVVFEAGDEDERAALQALHDKRLSLIARHAVLLLSRSPSCPSLTAPPKSLAAQRDYESIVPLLKRAALSNVDLYGRHDAEAEHGAGLDWRFGKGSQKAKASNLAWNTGAGPTRTYTRPCSADPEVGAAQQDQQTENAEPHGLDIDRPHTSGGLRGAHTSQEGMMRGDRAHTVYRLASRAYELLNHSLPKPQPGQPVEILRGVYTMVVRSRGLFVRLADTPDVRARFAIKRGIVHRDDLIWDPRGSWRHRQVLQSLAADRPATTCVHRLFRPTHCLSPSGLLYNISAPNAALPPPRPSTADEGQRAATPVRAFDCPAAWDPTFVLAPQGEVQMQNGIRARTADARLGSWTPVEAPWETDMKEKPQSSPLLRSSPMGRVVSPQRSQSSRPPPQELYSRRPREKQSFYYPPLEEPVSQTEEVELRGHEPSSRSSQQLRWSSDASLRKGLQEQWEELQRCMGSLQRTHSYGSKRMQKPSKRWSMADIRELLELRRCVASGLFKLTGVALEERSPGDDDQDHFYTHSSNVERTVERSKDDADRGPISATTGDIRQAHTDANRASAPASVKGDGGADGGNAASERSAIVDAPADPREASTCPNNAVIKRRGVWRSVPTKARLFIASPLKMLPEMSRRRQRRLLASFSPTPALLLRKIEHEMRMAVTRGMELAHLGGPPTVVLPCFRPLSPSMEEQRLALQRKGARPRKHPPQSPPKSEPQTQPQPELDDGESNDHALDPSETSLAVRIALRLDENSLHLQTPSVSTHSCSLKGTVSTSVHSCSGNKSERPRACCSRTSAAAGADIPATPCSLSSHNSGSSTCSGVWPPHLMRHHQPNVSPPPSYTASPTISPEVTRSTTLLSVPEVSSQKMLLSHGVRGSRAQYSESGGRQSRGKKRIKDRSPVYRLDRHLSHWPRVPNVE